MPVGVDLCVYPHVANNTIYDYHATSRDTQGDTQKGRHIGLPLRGIAYQHVTNKTILKCHIKGIHIGLPLHHMNNKYAI